MPEEFTARKVGKNLFIYKVSDFWNCAGSVNKILVPELTENNFWVMNNTTLTCQNLVDHIVKINSIKQDYPITLFSDGTVADGFHRILNAKINNVLMIKAKVLNLDPKPIKIVTVDDYLKGVI